MGTMALLSIIAGIAGTGLGGVIGLLFKNKSEKPISCVLNFAAGVMVAVVFFELIPEALFVIEDVKNKYFIVVLGIVLGVAVIAFLNWIVDIITQKKDKEQLNKQHKLEELSHSVDIIEIASGKKYKKKFFISGIIMMIAIGLHNLPEGLALGSSGAVAVENAILLTVLLALHNIPEGMAIAVPLISGGLNAWKTVMLTIISGSITVIGAVLGYALGNISPMVISICLSLAGGAMLYVTYGEILPQAVLLYNKRLPTLFNLFGVILGMLIIFLI